MPNPNIHQLTPDNAGFTVPDLQQFLAGPEQDLHKNTSKYTSSFGGYRADVPERPGLTVQWSNLEAVGDDGAPQTFRPLTLDNAEGYVRDYETELSRLALCGAVAPLHTTYIVEEDPNRERPARIYTVAHRSISRNLTGGVHKEGTPNHKRFLRAAGVMLAYHTQPSLSPWRIETAENIPAYTHHPDADILVGHEQVEFPDLTPTLTEKGHATTVALNRLVHELSPIAPFDTSGETAELLRRTLAYAISNNVQLSRLPQ